MGNSNNRKRSIFIKYLQISLGILCVVLGLIGIFIPILPTTPFLLLSAYLFIRSSQSLYRWVLTNRLTGNYIRNYIHYKAINPWIKALTLVILWGTISFSVYLMQGTLWIQILLIVIAIGVSIHLLTLRNMKKEMLDKRNNTE